MFVLSGAPSSIYHKTCPPVAGLKVLKNSEKKKYDLIIIQVQTKFKCQDRTHAHVRLRQY